eukprot:TRINITY_DN2481_c1_g1_i1.p1 TRINITY_DN2481_c1_g1~~TRINITY_DN2481_c1_g1_i1.p1  ORF type:complete len:997 (+),score=256.68 TRINITY_DN2481_c1_g1_i1:123-3113(+)
MSSESSEDEAENFAYKIEDILAVENFTHRQWDSICEVVETRYLRSGSLLSEDVEDSSNPKKQLHKGKRVLKMLEKLREVKLDVAKQESEGIQTDEEKEIRFLIKWKELSFLHVSWENTLDISTLICTKPQWYPLLRRLGALFVKRNLINSVEDFVEFVKKKKDSQNVKDPRDVDIDYCCLKLFKTASNPQPMLHTHSDLVNYVKENIIVSKIMADKGKDDDGIHWYLVRWQTPDYYATEECVEDFQDDFRLEEFKRFVTEYRRRRPYYNGLKQRIDAPRNSKKYTLMSMKNAPEFKGGNRLQEHQILGVNWLKFNWYAHRNSILADEMGLGKTVQALAFLDYLYKREHLYGPFLIVAPLSTIPNWARETEKWTDMRCVVYQGNAAARSEITKYEIFDTTQDKNKLRTNKKLLKFDILLTTRDMLLNDQRTFQSIDWVNMIVDEAHSLKDQKSKFYTTLQSIRASSKLLMTGTPIQNNMQELWALLNIIEYNKLGTTEEFVEQYETLPTDTDDEKNNKIGKLQDFMRPCVLRRKKKDVNIQLPKREESWIAVQLTPNQRDFYKSIYERNASAMHKHTKKMNLNNIAMELRKCCNHPYLIRGVEQVLLEGLRDKGVEVTPSIEMEALVKASGKMILLTKLLPRLKKEGHRVLLFSQFKIMLDLIEDYLVFNKEKFGRLDGDVTGNERQDVIDRFCEKDSDMLIMLISTRAGGVGINLTAADTIILFDSDWNPQNDEQAKARCHRIGQTKEVKVYRLVTADTYEMKMCQIASMKMGVDQAIIKHEENRKDPSNLSKKEMKDLLKYGAYDIFKEQAENNDKGQQFMDADIDTIMNQNCKVMSFDSEKEGKSSALATALFAPSENQSQEEIDALFARLAEENPDASIDDNVVKGKRERRQIDYSESANPTDGIFDGASSDDELAGRANSKYEFDGEEAESRRDIPLYERWTSTQCTKLFKLIFELGGSHHPNFLECTNDRSQQPVTIISFQTFSKSPNLPL